MNKTKKSLMIVSLVTLAISCLMLILAVFKVDVFHGIALRFLLIFATTSLACAIAISEINIIWRVSYDIMKKINKKVNKNARQIFNS